MNQLSDSTMCFFNYFFTLYISQINLQVVHCEKFISLCALLFLNDFLNPYKRPVCGESQGRELAI